MYKIKNRKKLIYMFCIVGKKKKKKKRYYFCYLYKKKKKKVVTIQCSYNLFYLKLTYDLNGNNKYIEIK